MTVWGLLDNKIGITLRGEIVQEFTEYCKRHNRPSLSHTAQLIIKQWLKDGGKLE